MRSKCDAYLDVVDGTICLADKNLGNISITNDVENVVLDLKEYGMLSYGHPVIYCDTDGQWCGVNINEKGFSHFVPLGYGLSKEAAITKAQELRQQGKL